MKNKASLILLFIVLLASVAVQSQNVGVGTNSPHSSAILDVQSINKGVSFPSMTTAQRKAIPNPKTGLLVYDLDKNTVYMFDGGQWVAFLFTASDAIIPPLTRVASDREVGDQFGYSVAINGNYAVVGAPSDNVGANTNQGCAYIFFRTGSVWTEQAKLLASDGAANDNFGYSVSINGNYVVIGSILDDSPLSNAGSAYVFIRSGTTWTEQAKLVASNPAVGDHFGCSVSLSGIYAAIGARDDDINTDTDEGSAYIFSRSGTTWSQQDNVIAPFGANGDAFGNCVAINGDYLIVGANLDDVGGVSNAGSAHIFLRSGNNWGYQDELLAESPLADDHFGEAVSISGDYAVAGLPYNPVYNGGRAYVFHRAGAVWSFETLLVANTHDFSVPVNQFGISVCIDGDYVIIGANHTSSPDVIRKGAAYVFKRDGDEWLMMRKIEDMPGAFSDNMGAAVGISGLNCIAGSSLADVQRGKVLLLNLE
jgi:hypothetical protein